MRGWLFLALAIGCGGSVADPIDGAANGDASVDVGVTDAPLPKMDAPFDCKSLEAKLAGMRTQLVTCCPFCNTPQCNHVTQDVCCPFSTTATNVSEFEGLVNEYKTQCMPACPAIPCQPVPSNVCVPGANPNAPGTCK